jgi:hypothetical protein
MLERDLMKSRHENDEFRTQVKQLERLLDQKDDFCETRRRRNTVAHGRLDTEDDEIDLITEDNYLELNVSTVSHESDSTVTVEQHEKELRHSDILAELNSESLEED